jgi:hypothetical protein
MIDFILGAAFMALFITWLTIWAGRKRAAEPEKVKCIQCQKVTTVEDIHHWEECPTHPAHKKIKEQETLVLSRIAKVASEYQRWNIVQEALTRLSNRIISNE